MKINIKEFVSFCLIKIILAVPVFDFLNLLSIILGPNFHQSNSGIPGGCQSIYDAGFILNYFTHSYCGHSDFEIYNNNIFILNILLAYFIVYCFDLYMQKIKIRKRLAIPVLFLLLISANFIIVTQITSIYTRGFNYISWFWQILMLTTFVLFFISSIHFYLKEYLILILNIKK